MRSRAFFILLMSAFAAMLGLGVISPFLPEFAKEHGANGFWMGMIFAGYGISRGAIMPLIGECSDKYGRKIFVATGLLIYTIISIFYPIAKSVYALTVVRMIHGLAAGMILPIVMAYVGEFAQKGKESRTIGRLNMMFYLGIATGPLLGGYIAQNFGFDAVFHAMALLGAFTFLIVVVFLPDSKARNQEILNKPMAFGVLLKYNYIRAVLLMTVLVTLFIVVFMSFLPSVAIKDHVNTVHIGYIISIGLFVAGILQIPFGNLADKHDRLGKLLQISLGTSIGMIALFLVPFCPDFTALLLCGCLVGLGAAIAAPTLAGISINIGRKVGMGRWMGIYNACMSTGYVITPIGAGILLDHWGIDAVFYVFGIFAFFALLLSGYFMHKRVKGHKI